MMDDVNINVENWSLFCANTTMTKWHSNGFKMTQRMIDEVNNALYKLQNISCTCTWKGDWELSPIST